MSVATANTSAFENDDLTNISSLITGSNSDDSARFWHCNISDTVITMTSTKQFPLRLWENNQGFIGENAMSWELTEEKLTIKTSHGYVSLYSVKFSTSDEVNDIFSATSSEGEPIACELKGPNRSLDINQFSFDDSSDVESFIHNFSSVTWECNGQIDSDNDFNIINFDHTGRGEVNSQVLTWYFDPDSNLFLSTGSSLTVVDDFQILVQSPEYRAFQGSVNGKSIDCSTVL